ncbi:DUF413 domain-containing protein [Thalassotalea mangrovi]|nr:DUF413 domain-containing protein [Thalassotalea mangrovi]
MLTNIRKGSAPFYGDQAFSHGLSRSGYFNRRESQELLEYGHTLLSLSQGVLMPENEEEALFVAEMQQADEGTLYPARLWKKYLAAVEKSKIRYGFSKANGRSSNFMDYADAFSD